MLNLLDKRPIDEAKIRTLAESYGLGHRVDEIIKLLQPAIAIQEYKTKSEPRGKESRIGGLPYLPVNIQWPTLGEKPLAFLGQINLEEVPDFPAKKALPTRGVLYFFSALGWEKFSYEESVHPENSKVIYFDGDVDSLQYTLLPDAMRTGQGLEAYEMRFQHIWTLPLARAKYRDPILPELGWSKEEYNQLHDMVVLGLRKLYDDTGLWTTKHLLGYASPVQGQVTRPGERFLISFSFDVPGGSAVGWLYFLIKDKDLAHYNFENVRREVQFAD